MIKLALLTLTGVFALTGCRQGRSNGESDASKSPEANGKRIYQVQGIIRRVADTTPEEWTFATGTTEEINRLTTAFRVYVKKDSETINHGLCTALVSPEGKIRAI